MAPHLLAKDPDAAKFARGPNRFNMYLCLPPDCPTVCHWELLPSDIE